MANEWHQISLGEIAEIKSGKRLPKEDNLTSTITPYPYIRLVDIKDGLINKKDMQYLHEKTQKIIKRYIVNSNDIGLAIVGHTIGMVFYVNSFWDGANLTENAARLTNFKKEVNPKFIYYYLISPMGQFEILSRKVGSAQGKLPLYAIKEIPVPLTSRKTQDSIVNFLNSLDDKIELNRQMNITLESMAQALFKSWFVDFDPVLDNTLAAGNPIPDELQSKAAARLALGNARKPLPAEIQALFPNTFVLTEEMGWIPKGWEDLNLSSLLEVKYGKDHKLLNEGSIPVYGSGGLMRYADTALYHGESILIPRKGTLSNLMYVNEAFWTVDTLFYSVPKIENTAKYLFYFLKTFDFNAMNVGSAVPSMTTKVLNELKVLKPSAKILTTFEHYLDAFFQKNKSIQDENKNLTKLRDTLLPKLLSGELRIPAAEPAVAEVL